MKIINRITGLVFVLLMAVSCREEKQIIGIKIYEYNGDFKMLVDQWKEMGINTVFVSRELAGKSDFRQLLKENSIDVFLIFPVFHDPVPLGRDSTLYALTESGKPAKDDWVEFVCPSRTEYRKNKVAEAASYINELNPDGLSVDFIRQFVFWEMIYPDRKPESIPEACYCDSCLKNFCRERNIRIPDTCITTVSKSRFIKSGYREEWNAFRCGLVTSMLRELSEEARVVKEDIIINTHLVPWRDSDFGGANINIASQDIREMSPYTDYISPMCYSQMLKRDAGWIASVVEEMDRKAPGKILPSIQVYPYYIDDRFTPEDFRKCFEMAVKAPSLGVVFFSWPLFEKDPARVDILRNRLSR